MLVEDLMSTEVVTCDYQSSLQTAVVQLLKENVGSVIVIGDEKPMGIVTETDALLAGAASKRPFHEIPIEKVVSTPVKTTMRDTPIRNAVERMRRNDIKKLPVTDGMELEGIITLTDIAINHSDILKEARKLCEQRERWEARKADIDEF
jgi:CBS domain-containing protein